MSLALSGDPIFIYVNTGRAVRWGNTKVERRGLTKGVLDSKYGQQVWTKTLLAPEVHILRALRRRPRTLDRATNPILP